MNPPRTPISDKPPSSPSPSQRMTPALSSSRHRLRQWATHPSMILSMGLSGLFLLVWNLGVRLPGKMDPLMISARSRAGQADPSQTRTPLNPQAMAALRREVQEARSYLVQDTGELVKLISKVERLALDQGWRAEVSLKPAVPAPSDLPAVTWIPTEIFLTNQPQAGQESSPSAYFRLLNFLRQLKDLNKKIDISYLNLKSGSTGLQYAETRLHIWTRQNDAESIAK